MQASAYHLGDRFHTKDILKIPNLELINKDPLCFRYEGIRIIVLKYGVVVFVYQKNKLKEDLLHLFHSKVDNPIPFENVSSETVVFHPRAETDDIRDGEIYASMNSQEFEMTLAVTLARSVIIEKYEKEVEGHLMDLGEVLSAFEQKGSTNLSSKDLIQLSGRAMRLRNSIVSRLSLLDKPDFTWEDDYIDTWFKRLDREYEISERYKILSKKIDTVFGDVEFILNFIETRKMYFLEVAIVLLFMLDILVLIAEYLF